MKTNTHPDSKNGNGSANGQLTKLVPSANNEKHIDVEPVREKLDQEQKTKLKRCEAMIKDGFDGMFEAGRALLTIRDERLYREKFSTFDEYCRERWGYSKTHANRMIGAAGVANVLTPIGVTVENESQVRALTGLKPAKVTKIWGKAAKMADGGRITANIVRRAVGEVVGKQERKKNQTKNARALKLLNRLEDAVNQDSRDQAIKLLRRIRNLLSP
jgi:hypothetical protein